MMVVVSFGCESWWVCVSFGDVLGTLEWRGFSPGSLGVEDVGVDAIGWGGVVVGVWVSMLCIEGFLVVWRVVRFLCGGIGCVSSILARVVGSVV